MKRLVIVIIALVCVCAFSCKKVSGPANGKSVQPNNNRDSTVNIICTINSVSWTTDSAFGLLQKQSANDSGVVNLIINATNYSGAIPTSMQLYITNYTGPNTYSIAPPANTATYYIGNNRNFATGGQIIITSDTTYALKGSFNFIADTITVASGVFNVALP